MCDNSTFLTLFFVSLIQIFLQIHNFRAKSTKSPRNQKPKKPRSVTTKNY